MILFSFLQRCEILINLLAGVEALSFSIDIVRIICVFYINMLCDDKNTVKTVSNIINIIYLR